MRSVVLTCIETRKYCLCLSIPLLCKPILNIWYWYRPIPSLYVCAVPYSGRFSWGPNFIVNECDHYSIYSSRLTIQEHSRGGFSYYRRG